MQTLKPCIWDVVHDGNKKAQALADRHYSRKTVGASKFCGPGQILVLLGCHGYALFVWRKSKYRKDGLKGVECTIFRNESAALSSYLIIEALKIARNRWPNENFFTYVNPSKIKSTDPGHCFKKAGWRKVGTNKTGKLILLEAPHLLTKVIK